MAQIYNSYRVTHEVTQGGAGFDYALLDVITGVIADNPGAAAERTEDELLKPGRISYLKAWAAGGYILAPQGEVKLGAGAGTYEACAVVPTLTPTDEQVNGSEWGQLVVMATFSDCPDSETAAQYFAQVLRAPAYSLWQAGGGIVRLAQEG